MSNLDEKFYCHKCKNDTNQSVVYKNVQLDPREIFFKSSRTQSAWIVEANIWKITKCRGCEHVNLLVETKHDSGSRPVATFLYPGKNMVEVPTWIFQLDEDYIQLLSEIYGAFNRGLSRLAIMGIRTAIDMVALDSVGDIGSFTKKTSELKKLGFISNDQERLVQAIIGTGNAATHRGYKPTDEDLLQLLAMVEHILHQKVLADNGDSILTGVPQRRPAK